jgi:hypothetical protein
MFRFFRRISHTSSAILSEFRIWLLIGISVVILASVSFLLFSPVFDVRYIHIRRQDPRIDIEEIEQALTPLFKQRLLFVTKGQIASLLQPEHPDIETVDIRKEYPSTLTITIHLEPVVATVTIDDTTENSLAGSGSTLTTSGAFLYLTRSGIFVVSPIKLTSTVPIEMLRLTDWGIRPQNRTNVIDPKFLQIIFAARDTLRTDFGLKSMDIVLYLRAREFHIRTNKVSLWFDLTSPLSVQFQRFREFLKNLSLDQAKEYIDLRIADRIVYR